LKEYQESEILQLIIGLTRAHARARVCVCVCICKENKINGDV